MHTLRHLIRVVAPYDVPLLLEGEESTGKRLVAEVIHSLSPYGDGPFIAVDCAALSEMLLGVELFGCAPGICAHYVPGLPGKMELANGGTIFLEHLEVVPRWIQRWLLRILETHTVERLGGNASVPVSVRIIGSIICCGKRAEASELGCRDLLDRLSGGFELKVPPLRDRGSDVVLLSRHFLAQANGEFRKQVQGFSARALTVLEAYAWPGNLRELKAVIRAAVLAADRIIAPQHLPFSVRAGKFRLVPSAG